MAIDDWVKKAMRNDAVVAEFLLRIKSSESVSYISALSFIRWGAKKPRSGRHGSAAASAGSWQRKEDEKYSTRCSPMTPLSWSGGTGSTSVSAEDGEECRSTAVLSHGHARSKATATSSNTGNSASTKKLKRKRTWYELCQEENTLYKEGMYLRKEIANKNATINAEKSRNESFKRIQFDIECSVSHYNPNSISDESPHTTSYQSQQRMPSKTFTYVTEVDTHPPPVEDSKATRECTFLLPDLNMMPSEDDFFTGDVSGTS